MKAIANVTRRFRADLRMLVTSGVTGGDSITRDMRKLVKRAVEDSYFEGLKAGGIAPEDMDETDAENIDQLNLVQQDFVTAFAKAVRDAQGDRAAQRDLLNNRVDLWTKSIEAAGEAGLNSAKANEMVEFRVKPGHSASEESCATCIRLLGQKHRRKWVTQHNLIPAPGNDHFECGGWRCPHVWLPVK